MEKVHCRCSSVSGRYYRERALITPEGQARLLIRASADPTRTLAPTTPSCPARAT